MQAAPPQPYYYATSAPTAPPSTTVHMSAAPSQPYFVLNGQQIVQQPSNSPTSFVWLQQAQPAPVQQQYFISSAPQQPLYVVQQPPPGSHHAAAGSMQSHTPMSMSMSIPSFVFSGAAPASMPTGMPPTGSMDLGGGLLLAPPSGSSSVHTTGQAPQRKSMVSSGHVSNGTTSNQLTSAHYGGSHGPLTHESEQPDPNVIHSVRPFLAPKSSIGSILDTPSKLPLLDTLPPLARRRPPPMQPPIARDAI